jgi:hypothetical protein
MGTNYYRIPKTSEVVKSLQQLYIDLQSIDFADPASTYNKFTVVDNDTWETHSPWDAFTKDMSIHLGKRSAGWKFCWNFHKGKYYNNKEELIKFVLSGRVVDEYGTSINPKEFLDMAFDWNPDGLVVNEEYYENNPSDSYFNNPKYYDLDIDGLRVSTSTEFS